MRLDTIQLIVQSMQRFPEHRELQFRACFALINLSIPNASRGIIREVGGIECIVAAMSSFHDFAMLQRCACNVLVSLAWSSRTNRERIANTEALRLVRQAVHNFPNFQDIVEIGATFMALMEQI